MKKFFRFIASPVFLASLLFLALQLPVFNLGLSYRDEGFFSYSAVRINNGEIPYRDFFLTTTPGTYYLNAFLFKLFGNQLIIGRLLYLLICLATIVLANNIFNLKKASNYWYLFSLSAALVWPGGFAYYNPEALFSILIGLFFLKKGLNQKNYLFFVLTGLATATGFFFKQTIGAFSGLSFLLIILLYSDKKGLKKTAVFLFSFALPVFCYLVYLFFNQALAPFFYYTTSFAGTVKAHRLPFLIQRLVFIPFLLLFFKKLFNLEIKTKKKVSLIFLTAFCLFFVYLVLLPSRLNALIDHLADPLFYFYSLVFFFPIMLLAFPFKNTAQNKDLKIYSIISLGFFLALGSSGYEIGAIKTLTVFIVPLLLLSKIIIQPVSFLLIVIYTSFVFTNPFSGQTKIFGVYPKNKQTETLSLPETKYLKISPEEKRELTEIVSYVKRNSLVSDKIVCFPYCPMLFVLTQRNNVSFFNLFYFETFLAKDQTRVIGELKTKKLALILIQKKGYIENEADFEDFRLNSLKVFLFQNTEKVLENNNFIVLSVN